MVRESSRADRFYSGRAFDMSLPNHILKLMRPEDRARLGKAGMTAEEGQAAHVARSERELQNQLVNLLRLNGVNFVINQRFGVKTTAPKGTPDILFAYRGKACAWEVKLEGEKPRPEQDRALMEMTADGWLCAVVRSYDEGRAFLANHSR